MNWVRLAMRLASIGALMGAGLMAACSARYEGHSEVGGFVPEAKAAAPSGAGAVPPIAMLGMPGEEVWVIGKAGPESAGSSEGAGAAMSGTDADGRAVSLPAVTMSVDAEITGCVASVSVKQGFANPSQTVVDATYEFRLPENAAVTDFVMTIGERHIRAIVRERKEARAIYEEARREGFRASLVEETRPNVFSEKIGNIEPGKTIDSEIRYFHTLSYVEGYWEWQFALAEAGGGAERSGRGISLTATVKGGVRGEDLVSVDHEVTRRSEAGSATVTLLAGEKIANKDFVLRWRAAGEKMRAGYFVERDRDGKGGTFSVVLIPPASKEGLARRAVDVTFVVDTSASMRGAAMEEAKAVVGEGLGKLDTGDQFEVIPLDAGGGAATPGRIAGAMAGLEKLQAGERAGDIPGDLARALGRPAGGGTRVVVLVSDGRIESQDYLAMLKVLRGTAADVRVLCVGVGPAVERAALDGMAMACHGEAAYPAEGGGRGAVGDYLAMVAHPALAEVALDFAGMRVADVYPKVVPQVFVGRPVVVMGRFTGEPARAIGVSGEVGGARVRMEALATPAAAGSGLGDLWTYDQMAELALDGVCAGRENSEEIERVALAHGLASFWTSFVVVDATGVAVGGR